MKRRFLLIPFVVLGLAACGGALASDTTEAPTMASEAPTVTEAPSTPAPAAEAPITTTASVEATVPAPPAPTEAAAPTEPPATEAPTPAPTEAPVTEAPALAVYVVAAVTDGDTIKLTDGSTVRLIGIDAPETGTCEGNVAAEALRNDLVVGTSVTLTMGGDGEDKDKYGRLLRYVDYDGNDVGAWMISTGNAIARYDSRDGYGRHDREDAYIAADAAAADYRCPPPPPPVTQPKPKPAVQPAPAPTPAPAPAPAPSGGGGDLDCSDIGHKVWVGDNDPHRLDADGDGWGCESYG